MDNRSILQIGVWHGVRHGCAAAQPNRLPALPMTPPTLFCAVPTRATARRSAVARGAGALLLGCLCQESGRRPRHRVHQPLQLQTPLRLLCLSPRPRMCRCGCAKWLAVTAATGDAARALPTFLRGQAISGRPELDVQVEGLPQGDRTHRTRRTAPWRHGDPGRPPRLLAARRPGQARGNVYVNRRGKPFRRTTAGTGSRRLPRLLHAAQLPLLRTKPTARRVAAGLHLESQTVAHNADYTTCQRQPGPSWLPDWVLTATRLDMDHDEEVGKAQGAVLRFKVLPVLPFRG